MEANTAPLQVLIVDDEPRIANLWAAILKAAACECQVVCSEQSALAALRERTFHVLLTDFDLGNATALSLLRAVNEQGLTLPTVLITGSVFALNTEDRAGFAAVLVKPVPANVLQSTVIQVARGAVASVAAPPNEVRARALVSVIQALALGRDQQFVIDVVRREVRKLIGCDGATFVLRDRDMSYYVDEDAIGPLFKGKRFPLNACIGGYCMLHKKPVVVPNIHADSRIPIEAYEATFVKSLVMVPICSEAPIGAIGAYWAHLHDVTNHELETLCTLADSASLALANVALINDLEQRVRERTAELVATNRELELFASAAAHDLRGPLALLHAGAEALLLDQEPLSAAQRERVENIRSTALEMAETLTNLLRLSRISSSQLRRVAVNVREHARAILAELEAAEPARNVEIVLPSALRVVADEKLLHIALQNLLSNAWKYTSKRAAARIEVGQTNTTRGPALFVADNGAGFDSAKASELFVPFKRLHERSEFPGTGIGLVTVARIATKHGGEVWAEATLGVGATFYVRLEPYHDERAGSLAS